MPVRLARFEMPNRLQKDDATATDTFSKFVAEPFEGGYGYTIGNSLRRVLLSSLEGAAITSVKIKGAPHEFCNLPGIVEDVTDIVLNIKQVALKMEDVRTHHPLMKVPTVDVAPLEALIRRHPQARLIILNGSGTVTPAAAANLTTLGQVYFDISHAEQVGALEQLVKVVPYERLLFGSHFPFFSLESALLKFRESELGGAVTSAIQSGNARALIGKK